MMNTIKNEVESVTSDSSSMVYDDDQFHYIFTADAVYPTGASKTLTEDAIRCGEIMLLKNEWCIRFKCEYCHKEMQHLDLFLKHSLSHTFEIQDETDINQLMDGVLIKSKPEDALMFNDELTISIDNLYDLNEDDKRSPNIKENINPLDTIKIVQNDESRTCSFTAINEVDVIENLSDSELQFVIKQFEDVHDGEDNDYENVSITNEDSSVSSEEADDENDNESQITSLEVEIYDIPQTIKASVSKPTTTSVNTIKNANKCLITEPYTCKYCKTQFAIKKYYESHMKRHTDERPYKCNICDAAFKDYSNFKVHCNRHLGVQPHSCQYCSKRFTTTTELSIHLRTHTGERPFICDKCGCSFKTSSYLQKHSRRHTNTRPYGCEICDKRFFDKKLLDDHKIAHTAARPFICNVCNMTFSRKKALQQHAKLHLNLFEYQCSYCERAFQQNAGLHAHIKSTHRNVNKK